MGTILIILLAIIVFLVIARTVIKFRKNRGRIVALSHWHHSFDGFQISAEDFYKSVTGLVEQKKMPKAEISRVTHYEGGFYTAEREYLRVERQELNFDICAAPFGTGFFVSWWLGSQPTTAQVLISLIPFIGDYLLEKLIPDTYYRKDTTLMFHDGVHGSVVEALEQQTSAKGLRALSESELKPIFNNKIFD